MGKITLPYIKGITDKIVRILGKKKISMAFFTHNSRNTLDQEIDPKDPDKKRGVYVIPFSCSKEYIGETGHAVRIRIKENCVDIMQNCIKRPALDEHSSQRGHQI